MPCLFKSLQIQEITKATRLMSADSYTIGLPGYAELRAIKSDLISGITSGTPRLRVLIRAIAGLSPGSVRVWHDTEQGWMAEGRKTPTSSPVYHQITEAEAAQLIGEHPKPELAHRMMEFDGYIGE
jgi:hypothetical protein